MWNLPNIVTLIRISMTPVVALLPFIEGYWPKFVAFLVFVTVALTDILDGYLARSRNQVTDLGKLLDPLADKLIVMASLVWMVPMGRIPGWIVIVLLAREISVTGLRSVAASEGVVISAGQEGKTKTALQMVGVIAILVGFPYPMRYLGFIDLGIVDLARVGRALVYLSLFFSLASAIDYVRIFGAAVEAKDKKLAKERASTSDLSPESDTGPS